MRAYKVSRFNITIIHHHDLDTLHAITNGQMKSLIGK